MSKYIFFEENGYMLKILDIGGGFPGTDEANICFTDIAHVINNSIDT